MLRGKHIAKFLAAGALLLVRAAGAEQISLTGSVLNIDSGQGLSSAKIHFEFYRLTERYENANAGFCDNKHTAVPVVFHVKTDDSGGFTLPKVATGQYLVVAHLSRSRPISVCLTAYGSAELKRWQCFACNSMIIRYSEKRAFFQGDVLMTSPGTAWIPSGCEPTHSLDGDEQALPATKVRFKYEDGHPIAGASITVYYGSVEHVPEVRLGSFKTDNSGVADFTSLYSKIQAMRLGEPVADLKIANLDSDDTWSGSTAIMSVAMKPAASSTPPQIILFKVKCGEDSLNTHWDTDVITK